MLKFGNSLFIRLSLVLVTSIILSLFISNSLWWFFISQEEERNTSYEIKYLSEEVKEYVDELNHLTSAQRSPVLKTLNRIGQSSYAFGNIYFVALSSNPLSFKAVEVEEKETNLLLKILSTSLNKSVSVVAIQNDNILEDEAVPEENEYIDTPIIDEYYNETLLESLLTIEEDIIEIAIVIQTQLDDGQWLALYTTPLSDRTHLGDILSPLNIIIVICSLPLILIFLFFAIRWVNAPLSKLAKKAENIGKDILLKQDSSASGPLEVQQIEFALSIMQDRIIEQITHSNDVFSAMSHDLKTPLTRMRIRAEMLDNITAKNKFISDIERLEQMITGALNYIKHTEIREDKCHIDMNALLNSIADDANDLGGKVSIKGECKNYYFGYPQGLRSCFANLIENAIFYGEKAEIYIDESDRAITISIIDNGPGIPEEDLKKVLIPYYRVDASRNLNTGGSGLGLSIAHKAIQAHMGELDIQNREDKLGLSLRVKLPFSSAEHCS